MKKKMEEFFRHRPNMLKKYTFPGDFGDFGRDIAGAVKPQDRNNSLTRQIIAEVERIFPGKISTQQLEKQLCQYPFVSYADHHGLLNYKLLYNSNLLYAEIVKEIALPYVLVLATGSVPLKNISYPRGFYFKGRKFNFFRKKQRDIPVFLVEEKLEAQRNPGLESFILNVNKENLTGEEKKFLECLFFEGLEIDNLPEGLETFSDQVSCLNFKLWKYYFHSRTRDSIPDMVYLQSNRLVLELLTRELQKEDSLVSTILFDRKAREAVFRNFYGIPCCWGDNAGSHFFWGVSPKKKLFPLTLNEDSNVLEGGQLSIEMTPAAILDALTGGMIMPAIFIDFLLFTFLDGYLALGGFNQVDFLPRMQAAHLKSLEEMGKTGMSESFSSRVTDGLICGMFPFDFDSGIDLIWHYNSRDGKFNGNLEGGLTGEELAKVKHMPVKDLIGSAVEMMLEIVE